MAINLNLLLKVMVQNKASDTHIRGDSQVYLRINGNITPINSSGMTQKEVEEMIFPLMNQRLKSIFAEKHEADFSMDGGELGRYAYEKHAEDDDFGQAGTLYRDVMDDTDRDHLAANIVGHASERVTGPMKERVTAYWARVDPQLGARIAAGLGTSASAAATELVSARANRA